VAAKKKSKDDKKPERKSLSGETVEQVSRDLRPKNAAEDRYARPVLVYEDDVNQVATYPTRIRKLNRLLGGGFPAGSITEIGGLPESGKSSLAATIAADVQQRAPEGQKTVVLLNYEHRLDRKASWAWWRKLGLDTSKENFKLLMPLSLEAGIAPATRYVRTGEVCCLIIDSVYAGGSREGQDAVAAMDDPNAKKAPIGIEAAKWGQIWTAFVPLLSETNTVCLAVNQSRVVINTAGGGGGYGPQYETGRGEALKFYSWFRLMVSGAQLDRSEGGRWKDQDVDGRNVRFKVVKNGINAAAKGHARMDLIRGEGWDLVGDLVDSALELGVIEHQGSGRYEFEGEQVAHGAKKLYSNLSEDAPFRAKVEAAVEVALAPLEEGASAPEEASVEEAPEVEA
jgi:RecA/RadA recombinase